MDEYAFRQAHSLVNRDVTDGMATSSFVFVINRERYFVFMTATAENSVSHKCVVTKGSKL